MNQIARVNNPFAAQAPAKHGGALVESESQRAIQEVQAAMVIAKKFPRDQASALDRILNACTRPTLAEGALYSYARGGTDVTGPSIRLAETIAQEWGNIQVGVRELSQQNGESTVEAFAWDVERNVKQVKVFQVAHKRNTKSGSKALTDPRDIYEMVANQGARRLRACILGVIPGDVVEAAVQQCDVTLNAKADTSPEGVKKMVSALADFGVTPEMISKRIQKRLESINAAQIVQLRKIWSSLKDGMSNPSDWFDMPQEKTEQHVSDLDKELIAPAKEKPDTSALRDGLLNTISQAESLDELEQIGKDIREDYAKTLDKDDLEEIRAAFASRKHEMESAA